MAKAKKAASDVLPAQKRVDLFVAAINDLQEQFQVGLKVIIDRQEGADVAVIRFVDLIEANKNAKEKGPVSAEA